jgi:hypothetical protein
MPISRRTFTYLYLPFPNANLQAGLSMHCRTIDNAAIF